MDKKDSIVPIKAEGVVIGTREETPFDDVNVNIESISLTSRGVQLIVGARPKIVEIDVGGLQMVYVLLYTTQKEQADGTDSEAYPLRREQTMGIINESFTQRNLIPITEDGPYLAPSYGGNSLAPYNHPLLKSSYNNLEDLSTDYPKLGDRFKEFTDEQQLTEGLLFRIIARDNTLSERLEEIRVPYETRVIPNGHVVRLLSFEYRNLIKKGDEFLESRACFCD